jgi:hypothetical protein
MVLLDRYEIHAIPLDVYFSFKIYFKLNFFKILSVRVHFCPGFPLGGGFPAEKNTHMVLCMNRIPQEHKTGFLRCYAYFEYWRSKNQTVCSPGNSPLCGNLNTTGAVLSGTPSSKEQ